MIETDQARPLGWDQHRLVLFDANPREAGWLAWLEPLSSWAAASWGGVLGLGSSFAAGLVYLRTGAAGLAAVAGVAALVLSVLALACGLAAGADAGG